jgi:hypothetical protein
MDRLQPARVLEFTELNEDETALILLPQGRLLEVTWLDGENYAIKVAGFQSIEKYRADEEYRLSGFEPLLSDFSGYIPMAAPDIYSQRQECVRR